MLSANKFSKYRHFGCCNDFKYIYTFSKCICHVNFPVNYYGISTFVLPPFDGPQMIPHIEIGIMFPCLRISFSIYFIIDISHFNLLKVCDCRTNFISSPFTTSKKRHRILKKTTSRMYVFIVAQSETAQYSK